MRSEDTAKHSACLNRHCDYGELSGDCEYTSLSRLSIFLETIADVLRNWL